MNKEVFRNQVIVALEEKFGQDYEISARDVVKNNGVVSSAIVVRPINSIVAPTIYVDEAFARYENGEDFSSLVTKLYDVVQEGLAVQPQNVNFGSFEDVKDKIYVLLVRDSDYVTDKVARDFLDLKVLAYIDVTDINGIITVTKSLASSWGVSEDEILDTGLENLKRNVRFKNTPIMQLLVQMMGAPILADEDAPMDDPIKVVLPEKDTFKFGAAVLLNTDYLQMLSNEANEDLFIIPSSIYEVLVLPKSQFEDGAEIVSVIKEVNTTEVAPDEILSDTLYEFSNGQVKIADV